MKRCITAVGISTTVAAILGCAVGEDYGSLDYRIDRPRVLAIRVTPRVSVADDPIQIEALGVVPRGREIEEISVDVCLPEEAWILNQVPFACFAEPDLVRHVASALPATWQPPDVSDLPCEADPPSEPGDSGIPFPWQCVSSVPLLVEVHDGQQSGYGGFNVSIPVGDAARRALPSAPPGFEQAGRIVVRGTPRAAEIVDLSFVLDLPPVPGLSFSWYVDDGELLRTGHTSVHSVQGDPPRSVVTTNRLRIPDAYEGPLRIFVVASAHERTSVENLEGASAELSFVDLFQPSSVTTLGTVMVWGSHVMQVEP